MCMNACGRINLFSRNWYKFNWSFNLLALKEKGERERERDRDRDKERETDRERDRERETERGECKKTTIISNTLVLCIHRDHTH